MTIATFVRRKLATARLRWTLYFSFRRLAKFNRIAIREEARLAAHREDLNRRVYAAHERMATMDLAERVTLLPALIRENEALEAEERDLRGSRQSLQDGLAELVADRRPNLKLVTRKSA